MKKLILSVTAIAGLAMAGNAQQVLFHDSNGSAPTSNDITINGVVSTADLNMELLVGATSSTVTTDVVTLLLSQATGTATTALGTTQPALGDVSKFGLIVDQTGNAYSVPAGTDWYQVLVWQGNSATYPGAGVSGAGASPIYQFDIAGGIPAAGAPAAQLDLPTSINVTVTAVPEPSTLAMAGVGLASMLLFRRRNK